MGWKLRVSGYGKIEKTEMESAPFTLFVGDNNSGKSYLMALLWGLQNLGAEVLFAGEAESLTEAERRLTGWIESQVDAARNQGDQTACLGEVKEELNIVLNERLNRNKNKLAAAVFNCPDVEIEELQMEWTGLEKLAMKTSLHVFGGNVQISIRVGSAGIICLGDVNHQRFIQWLLHLLINQGVDFSIRDNRSIYLPAARTGFMLSKDAINKAARRATFNIGMEQEPLIPFIRPINQFLDVINDLSLEEKGNDAFEEVIRCLESDMAEGTVEMAAMPNKEVLYVPNGGAAGIPLRVSSAVVTELSPLILILKHKHGLSTLFYEEPEMCLHPQLQQKVARVLCLLANAGLWMNVTTHSDIVLQHINNMIRLSKREDREEICRQFGYTARDLLDPGMVKVYQFKARAGGKAEVEELACGENGFAIPTFNDALDRIMDEAYVIQE